MPLFKEYWQKLQENHPEWLTDEWKEDLPPLMYFQIYGVDKAKQPSLLTSSSLVVPTSYAPDDDNR